MWSSLLLLLVAVLLLPLLWGMYRVSTLRFQDIRGEIVDPEDVPPEVLENLKLQVEPLLSGGFEYLGMRSEGRLQETYWQTFLSSAGGRVWAVAEESGRHRRRVSFLSFGEDGTVAVTRDGGENFGEREPNVILRQRSFATALEQAESHAELLNQSNMKLEAWEPEVFLQRYERLSVSGLDHLFDKGWIEKGGNGVVKVPLAKLPVVTFKWFHNWWQLRKREKLGRSWLLNEKLLSPAPELSEGEVAETLVEEVAEQESSEVEGEVLVEEALPVGEVEYEGEVTEALDASDKGLHGIAASAIEAFPEPEYPEENELLEEASFESFPTETEQATEEAVFEEASAEGIVEEAVADAEESDLEPEIPAEDGLPRDLALYEKQASVKSWAYWLGGFGARAFLCISLFVFFFWVAMSWGWGMKAVVLGLLVLLIHEAGHALLMLMRRAWDWSLFLFPIPHPMSAKQWRILGGWSEFFTIIAGPLPGLIFGWLILFMAYF